MGKLENGASSTAALTCVIGPLCHTVLCAYDNVCLQRYMGCGTDVWIETAIMPTLPASFCRHCLRHIADIACAIVPTMPAIVCRHMLLHYVVAAEEAAFGPGLSYIADSLRAHWRPVRCVLALLQAPTLELGWRFYGLIP